MDSWDAEKLGELMISWNRLQAVVILPLKIPVFFG